MQISKFVVLSFKKTSLCSSMIIWWKEVYKKQSCYIQRFLKQSCQCGCTETNPNLKINQAYVLSTLTKTTRWTFDQNQKIRYSSVFQSHQVLMK